MGRAEDGLREVLERIANACSRAGRDATSVRLVAVSKTVAAERVREIVAAGHTTFGENRVQEALAKIPEVGGGAVWHLVGRLQRNKARLAAGVFELIHSVDGVELAREIDRRAAGRGLVQRVLLQVNLSREETKAGFDAPEVVGALREMAGLQYLQVEGLMTIPPPADRTDESRRWFVRLREVRDRAEVELGIALPQLSMGMTDDFEVAIEEGATLVRVGRAIFGDRNG